jgi:hypothetical protein
MPLNFFNEVFITFMLIPICKQRAIEAAEFKTLCEPIKFNFIFFIVIFFTPGSDILRSKIE